MTQKTTDGPGARCPGHHDRGDHTSFQCVLDAGHDGYCQPYRAPDVDEWRRLCARAARMEAEATELLAIIDSGARTASNASATDVATIESASGLCADLALYQQEANMLRDLVESGDIEAPWRAEVARLQAENDALRAEIAAAEAKTARMEARTATACECTMRGGALGVRVPSGTVACPPDRVPGDALRPRSCECHGYGFKRCGVCGGTGAVIVEPAGEDR